MAIMSHGDLIDAPTAAPTTMHAVIYRYSKIIYFSSSLPTRPTSGR